MQTAQILDYEIGSIKDARFDTKINSGIKEMLKLASMLEGIDLSAFIISAATQKARDIIEHSESLKLDDIQYKRFLEIIEEPPKATNELKNLLSKNDLNER